MNVYSILCLSLTLAHHGFANGTESTSDESTLSSSENPQSPSESSTTESSPCPENMELWLTKNKDCFCVWPFLPIPLNGTCCKPYRQGPCPPGDFVPQPAYSSHNNGEPRCVPNPCVKDGLVPANGTCIDITARPPCSFRFPYYNETISEIQCIRLKMRLISAITAPFRYKCPSGSHPDNYGKCRRPL